MNILFRNVWLASGTGTPYNAALMMIKDDRYMSIDGLLKAWVQDLNNTHCLW